MIETREKCKPKPNRVVFARGDALTIPIMIMNNGAIVTSTDVADVSITFDEITKNLSDTPTEITYNSTTKLWSFPLSQTETFDMDVGEKLFGVRVKFTGSPTVIKSMHLPNALVLDAVNEEEL